MKCEKTVQKHSIGKKITKAFNIIAQVSLVFYYTIGPAVLLMPNRASAATLTPGTIWTTRGDCGDETQDVNHYNVGEHVFINGKNFSAGQKDWNITGQPGGASGDPNIVVASGHYTVGPSGAFCFDAYTVLDDDWGEYDVTFARKHDNYRVNGYVAGHKYNDPNGDGNLSDGIPLSDWEIKATRGTHIKTTITDQNGAYIFSFADSEHGNWVISETMQAGWTQTAPHHGTYTVHVGNNTHATGKDFGNHQPTGSVKVNKKVDANGDGTFEGGNTEANALGFKWGLDNGPVNHNMGATVSDVSTGSHTVTENTVAGYHFVGWYVTGSTHHSCTNPEDTDLPVGISVTDGHTTSITLCNARDTGTLKVIKVVNGGPAEPDDFGFRIVGWQGEYEYPASGQNFVEFDNLITGPYSVEETSVPNYVLSNNTCEDITVAAGQTVECTMTNTYHEPEPMTIVAHKIVCDNESDLPDWGVNSPAGPDITAATAQDWINAHPSCHFASDWRFQWSYDGVPNPGDNKGESSSPDWHTFGPTDDTGLASTTISDLHGTPKIWVREAWQDNYIRFASVINTDEPQYSAEFYCHTDVLNFDNWEWIGNPELEHTYYCVAFNVRQTGKVTFEKQIKGEGDPNDWTFTVDGHTYANGETVSLPTGVYTVIENGPDGYTNTGVDGICSQDATRASAVGARMNVTTEGGKCIFINEQDTGTVLVNKEVDTDGDGTFDGGNDVANVLGFRWSIDGGPADKNMGTSLNEPIGQHTVNENPQTDTGYHFVGWFVNPNVTTHAQEEKYSCLNPQGTTLPVDINVFTDGTTTVTLCNARDTGNLTVYKNVINGDNLASDWLIHVKQNGTDVTGSPQAGSESGTTYTLPTDQYVVSETDGPADIGYTASFSENCPNGNVTVTTEGATCTIVNTRNAGTITVNKQVDTDGDGSYDGQNDVANTLGFRWGIDPKNLTNEMGSQINVGTGTYSIFENPMSGYHFVGWFTDEGSCADPAGITMPINIDVSERSSITLCNARDTGQLTIRKQIDNNGDGSVDVTDPVGWTYDIQNGDQGISMGTSRNLPTDTYTISENQQADYEATAWECYRGEDKVGSGSGEELTVNLTTEGAVCMFTNTRLLPILTLTKTVDATKAVNPGAEVNYTVTVKNTGYATAKNLVLNDVMPTELYYSDVLGSSRTFVSGGDLAIGDTLTFTYPVTVKTGTADGDYVNTATLTSDNYKTLTAQATIAVTQGTVKGETAVPKLVIEKSVDVSFANPGDTVTYTVKISNTGEAPADQLVLGDILPAGFSFVETGGTTRSWDLGTLAQGKSVTVSYEVDIASSVAAGTYDNIATASADNADPVTAKKKLEVKSVEVKGEETGPELPQTGAGLMDYVIFGSALITLAGSALGLRRSVRATKVKRS
ncbi:MAG: DUF11 domain-containing protein [Patescibacteria group bacterium]